MEHIDGWIIWVETENTCGCARTTLDDPKGRARYGEWWLWGMGRVVAFEKKADAIAYAKMVRKPRKGYFNVLHANIMPFRLANLRGLKP